MERLVAFQLGRELGKYQTALVAVTGKDDEVLTDLPRQGLDEMAGLALPAPG